MWNSGGREVKGEILFGAHSVEAALRFGSRRKYHGLMALRNAKGEDATGANKKSDVVRERIVRLAEERDIPVHWLSRHEMNSLPNTHQQKLSTGGGVALDCSPLDKIQKVSCVDEINSMTSGSSMNRRVIIFLDEVSDPRNMGATLRTACFFGADAVIIAAKNSSPLSPVVSRSSAGALEVLSANQRLAYSHGPLPNILASLADAGWDVVGTVVAGADVVDLKKVNTRENTAIVFGSEGRGIRKMIRRACTTLVTMPAAPGSGSIDSLNVSVASALVMHRYLQRD